MFLLIRKIFSAIERRIASTSSDAFVRYLRKKGVAIGSNVMFHQRKNVMIDLTRPSLVTIGNDVHLTQGLTILTHGYDWVVLRDLYGEMVSSSGRVTIGNHVFIGFNTLILKGVSIGDYCIIGAGSVVTKSIPARSVAAGNPAKVVCSIDEYYQKRKSAHVEEAKEYARSILERFNRRPIPSDFREEFPLFVDGDNRILDLPVDEQLGKFSGHFRETHHSKFRGFEDFLKDCGIK